MRKYSARMLFEDFKRAYPGLFRRGIHYELCGFMKIRVRIPTVGVVEYEYFNNKLTWITEYENADEISEKDTRKRNDMYDCFINSLRNKMQQFNWTQQDVADMTGYSRKSINEYLSGKSIPKISTMKKICSVLNITDF